MATESASSLDFPRHSSTWQWEHPFARSTAPCKSTLPPTLRRWPLGTSSTLQLARRLCRLPPLHHLAGQGQTSGDRRRHSRQETRNFVGKRLVVGLAGACRSEEHTSELKSLMRTSYAVFLLQQNI